MNIIFLDFDGVLHPVFPRVDRPHSENQHFSYADRLASTLDAIPEDVKLVVTSEWRRSRSIREIKAALPQLADRIIGTTPISTTRYPCYREDEALRWIHLNCRHPKDVKWAAVDDVAGIWRTADKVMICDDGFRATEAETLLTYIRRMWEAPTADLFSSPGCGVIEEMQLVS